MSLFKKIKSLFGKEEDTGIKTNDLFKEKSGPEFCSRCIQGPLCEYKPLNPAMPCDYNVDMEDFDPEKDSILIIDDNPGIISFLIDDLSLLQHTNKAPDDINIITISGSHAAFELGTLLKHKELNIKYAIIDITLGGTKLLNEKSIKLNGVDVFEMIQSDDLSYIFYTGNNLNAYIKSNKEMIDKFHSLTNEKIQDYVLFKTSLNVDSRQNRIAEMLFN